MVKMDFIQDVKNVTIKDVKNGMKTQQTKKKYKKSKQNITIDNATKYSKKQEINVYVAVQQMKNQKRKEKEVLNYMKYMEKNIPILFLRKDKNI